jgi:hypothetical protein
MRGDFGTQVFFGVVKRVLNQCCVGTLEFLAQLLEVLIYGARRVAVHDEGPFTNRSTKPRVPCQMEVHSVNTARPPSVIR